MKFQERLLPARKATNIYGPRRLHTHLFQRRAMGHGGNNEPAIVLEADEATVKEVVNTRGQEEPVLAIQSFFV